MTFQRPEMLWALALMLPYAALEALSLARGRAWARILAPGAQAERAERDWTVRRIARALSGAVAWIFAVAALAGPSWGFLPSAGRSSGVEAALVLDVSNSMLSKDITPSRLEAARDTARALTRLRAESPFSLTVFKGGAALLCPATDDPDALDQALDWAVPEVVTSPGSSVASGIETALGAFSQNPGLAKYIILFSDGDDLAGGAARAVQEARDRGVRILAVGCGGVSEIPAEDESGTIIRLADGVPARTALRASALKKWAEDTEGTYWDVSDPTTLKGLADALDSRPGAPGSRLLSQPADRTGLFALLALIGLAGRGAASIPGRPDNRKSRRRAASVLLIGLTLTGCSSARLDVLHGNRLVERGRFEEAIAAYLKAGQEEGDGVVALDLGGVYSRMGETAAAGPLYERAQDSSDPRVAAAAFHNLGVQLFESSRFDEAAESFKNALRLFPEDVETKRALELSQSAATSAVSRSIQRQGASVNPGGRDEALFSLLRRMESDWFRPSESGSQATGGPDY